MRIRSTNGTGTTAYVYDTNARLSRLLMKETDGTVTKYVYGVGLIGEIRTGVFKTYHFDYRGSTVAVTSECGEELSAFTYDTYGKLLSRTGTFKPIFLYNGRDGVVTDPNGLLYMRARYYSPVLRRFMNADLLAGDISDARTLNRYSYVCGDPVSFVDPFGLSAERGNLGPTALEAAYMAAHIYNAKLENDKNKDLGPEFGGWRLEDILVDDNGFKIGVYYRFGDDGTKEYAFVNKGSSTVDDWMDNLKQPFGFSDDMRRSTAYAEEFVKKHPDAHITFIGHSKGGAEAIANALATNRDAIVFNPARANYKFYGLSASGYTADMKSYVITGEALSVVYACIDALPILHPLAISSASPYDNFFTSIVPGVLNISDPVEKIVPLPNPEGNMVDDHSIYSVIKALQM